MFLIFLLYNKLFQAVCQKQTKQFIMNREREESWILYSLLALITLHITPRTSILLI